MNAHAPVEGDPFFLPAFRAPTSLPEFEPDHLVEQLPPSTFAPPPVDTRALDYDTINAEIDRLEARLQVLKIQAARLA